MPLCSEGSSSESSRTTARSEGHSWAWWLQLSCFWSLSSDNCWSGRLVGIWNYTSTFPEWPARQVPPLLCTVSQHLQSGADKIETLPLAIADSKIASMLGTITKELGYRLKAKLGELLPDSAAPLNFAGLFGQWHYCCGCFYSQKRRKKSFQKSPSKTYWTPHSRWTQSETKGLFTLFHFGHLWERAKICGRLSNAPIKDSCPVAKFTPSLIYNQVLTVWLTLPPTSKKTKQKTKNDADSPSRWLHKWTITCKSNRKQHKRKNIYFKTSFAYFYVISTDKSSTNQMTQADDLSLPSYSSALWCSLITQSEAETCLTLCDMSLTKVVFTV